MKFTHDFISKQLPDFNSIFQLHFHTRWILMRYDKSSREHFFFHENTSQNKYLQKKISNTGVRISNPQAEYYKKFFLHVTFKFQLTLMVD